MADAMYGNYTGDAQKKLLDILNDTVKVMLLDASYTPNLDTHTRRSDLSGEVAGSGGYTTGGWTLAGKSLTYDSTNDRWVFDANDINQDPTTIAGARWGVMYVALGGLASADPLVMLIDFGSARTTSGEPFKITWNASGIFAV